MIHLFTGPLPSELYPPPSHGRADTLAIKESIAQHLSEVDGSNYWDSLAKFFKGKLDRNEFESNTLPLLKSEKLIGLHNALIFSILYNATRPELPPNQENDDKSHLHTSGHGWSKRKRTSPPSPPPVATITTTMVTSNPTSQSKEIITLDNDTRKQDERDSKKRKLKQAVLALGQRERNRIKEIASSNVPINNNSKKQSQSLVENQNLPNLSQPPQQHSDQAKVYNRSKYLAHQRTPNVLNTPLASKMKISSSTLYQDYMRCQGALICSESRQLPDFDTLKDRMSLIAYDSGLINGVEKSASSLALIGLEVHLKTLLGDLLSLVRSDRSISSNSINSSEFNHVNPDIKSAEPSDHQIQTLVPSTSHQPTSETLNDLDPSSSNPIKPTPVTLINQASSNLRLRDLKTQGLAPHLTSRDVAALAEISPHAFVRTHPVALERLIATCSSSSSSPDNLGSGCNLNSSETFDKKATLIPRVWPKPIMIEPRFGNSLSSS